MNRKSFALFILLEIFCAKAFSQDYFSYGGGNFCGLTQVIGNPAAAADNRLKVEVLVRGAEYNFNNSFFEIQRAALNYTGTVFKPSSIKLPSTWQNRTPNVADNFYKNFNVLASDKSRSLVYEDRLVMPSALYQIDAKNSVAFVWSKRRIGNLEGIEDQLVNLFKNEFDLGVTQNNRIQNKQINAIYMSWAEYGFTYARVLQDNSKHFFKAGITPKIIQGVESAYAIVNNLDFLFNTKDSTSYFDADVSFAKSKNYKSPFNNEQKQRGTTPLKLGLDLGLVYEWRPNRYRYRYKPDSVKSVWRNDLNKYKLKLSGAIVDIGRIKYYKEDDFYDLRLSLQNQDFVNLTTAEDVQMLDSIIRTDFSDGNGESTYTMLLPTALNLQVDYSINQLFYLNLSARITNFYGSNYKVHNFSAVCFSPRIEHYLFNLSLPFTFNTLSAKRSQVISTGLNIRLGPLNLGTNNIVPYFKGNVSALNFYAAFRIAIPYKLIKDQDGDGVLDKYDLCPDEFGTAETKGCADKDKDGIPDKDDLCPNQAGSIDKKGCP